MEEAFRIAGGIVAGLMLTIVAVTVPVPSGSHQPAGRKPLKPRASKSPATPEAKRNMLS